MATYGSASNPVTTLTGINFSDPTNTVYCYVGQNTSFVNCAVNGGMPAMAITSQSNVSNVSFSGGTTWSLSFTLTSSSGSIVIRTPQGGLTFNLIGVQAGPTVEGSGTQADPYTKITNVGFEWLDTQPITTYVAIGTVIDIRDDEFELNASDPSLPVYGLAYDSSLGYWSLHGTVSANAGNTLEIWLDNGEEEWLSCTFVFVSSGPTLNVKVSGAWKEGKPYVKVNGAWKEATKVYVKVNGAWKESQ